MPAELFGERYRFLAKPEILTFEEITRLTGVMVKFGVRKVRLTGGEPLVRNNIDLLVGMLAKIAGINDLTLTTNGFMLAKKARKLKEAGLHRVTVSLDSLEDDVFKKMSGRGYSVKQVLEGIRLAEEVGLPIKINVVVQRGVNDHTIVDLARHFRETGQVVRFIEFMDVGNLNNWKMDKVVPSAEVIEHIDSVFPLESLDPSYAGEVAKRYRYKDGGGEIGVISSVTMPFCGDCTRIRISPEGKLVTCLFASTGLDLREPLRKGYSDEHLEEIVERLWLGRADRYSEERATLTGYQPKKIEMYQIGG